ncbi:filamentous hemagglutinin N-terminal domain-containing protein [Candidatus Parabeggiatoa sp. HSG14]|uniref:two-partner secretion domain-containing protein n=1 Tax=Candidatus Parabeggiatoa sp. HSG14 TaxID=3055593 RepID=UPI0025A7B8B5|nr:filamentous hemagglutinin N-terminal domain-containing protein [Thiotrichales bacterium HSG14]
MKSHAFLAILLLIISLSINAEITTDGSLGSRANLPGPNYLIGADLGQQHGGNLFHSFQDFNLNSAESATFSGPNSVQNILSRVTGGNPSNIDGLIHSTIPNAAFYFLNPNGIMFGPNARLDVQGSFHASTADYLHLGEGGRFDARNPNDSILTIAPIESFGFLNNPHGTIQINGRGILNESETPRALLQVPEGKSLSLIGGEIHLSQGVDELPLEILTEGSPEEIQAAEYRNQHFSQLYASGGTLNLASIQQAGEIVLTKNGLNSTATLNGMIQLEQEAFISTTGKSGGNVFIRSGQFSMDNSTIYSRTLGIQDGGVIDIRADNIELNNLSKIRGGTENTGDGTDIQLSANESIYLNNNSPLNTESGNMSNLNQQMGDAGHISLQAKDIEVKNVYIANGIFSSNTFGTGQGGDIRLSAENSLNIVDNSVILAGTFGNDTFAGKSGDIYLQANTLNVDSNIAAASYGRADAGQLVITSGQLYVGSTDEISPYLSTNGFEQGNGGKITIQADDIQLENGAIISTTTSGKGKAGDINIQVSNQLIIQGAGGEFGVATGILSTSSAIVDNTQTGDAANIHIRAKEIITETGGRIDAGSKAYFPTATSGQAGNIFLEIENALILTGVNPYGENYQGFGSVISARNMGNSGDAGNIQIQAGSVSVLDGALIETGTDNENYGGNIQIQANKHILISGDASQITLNDPAWSQLAYLVMFNPPTHNQSTSGIYSHSTSSAMNSGNSGQIELSTPQLTMSRQSQISTSNQGGGKAGQITLNVSKLVLSDDALIRSNSDLVNQFTFDSISTRDNRLVSTGTVVKTLDIGEGKAIYQINLGNTLVNLMPITQVADMTELKQVTEQVQLSYLYGDMVIVENAGNGQSARFLYVYSDAVNETWTKIDENSQVILEHADFSVDVTTFIGGTQPPYKDGTKIHVKDIGHGKAADFVYSIVTSVDSSTELAWGKAYRVKYYQVADTTALHDLAANTDLLIGTQVDIGQAENGNPARFVFDGNDWVRFGQVLEIADVPARENLVLAQPGHISHFPNGDSIYTGNKWIDLGQTHRVSNLAERNVLNAQHGDLVKVADVGNGRHDAFLYADGKWIQQIRGGNAGQIVVNADKIQLINGSEISTGSISGGGGSITLNVDKLVFLTDSQVSTSVQEGAGNGGDLSLNPEFVILENGKIIARANEGHGGNINITTTGIYTFPPKSTSTIDASSKLGIDGSVHVESPDVNMDDFLVILPGGFTEVQLKQCDNGEIENPSTFKVDLTSKKILPFE